MPLHDWTKVNAGLYHHFHQGFTLEISSSLNRGLLPNSYAAILEPNSNYNGENDAQSYASKANRVVIRHELNKAIAFIDVVSPGNKESEAAIRDQRVR